VEDPGHNAGRDEQQHRRGGYPRGGATPAGLPGQAGSELAKLFQLARRSDLAVPPTGIPALEFPVISCPGPCELSWAMQPAWPAADGRSTAAVCQSPASDTGKGGSVSAYDVVRN